MFKVMRQALRRLTLEWQRQAAVAELSKMDDYLLADIGLRCEQLPTLTFETPRENAKTHSPKSVYSPELAICG